MTEEFIVSDFKYETYKCFFGNGFRFRVIEEDEQELKRFAEWLNKKIIPDDSSKNWPQDDDCNEQGQCWFEHPGGEGWMLIDRSYALNHKVKWLPHYAFPVAASRPL